MARVAPAPIRAGEGDEGYPDPELSWVQNLLDPEQQFSAAAARQVLGDDPDFAMLRKRWNEVGKGSEFLNKEQFKKMCGIKWPESSKRLFDMFRNPKADHLNLHELIRDLNLLMTSSPEMKLRFIFKLYDADDNGRLDPLELKLVFEYSTEECNLVLSESVIEILVLHCFQTMDVDEDGMISFEELYDECKNFPALLESITLRPNEFLHLENKKSVNPATDSGQSWYRLALLNVTGRVWLVIYILGLLLSLIIAPIIYAVEGKQEEYVSTGNITNVTFNTLVIKEGELNLMTQDDAVYVFTEMFGICLAFHIVLTMLLVMRHLQAYIRVTKVRSFVVVDLHTQMHRTVGYISLIVAVIHMIFALGLIQVDRNNRDDSEPTTPAYWEYLFTRKGRVGWLIEGLAYPTGIGMMLCLCVISMFANNRFRGKNKFWIFYVTHPFHILLVVLAVFHTLGSCVAALLPFGMYIFERLVPFINRKRSKHQVRGVTILPSKVLHVRLSMPPGFKYQPGDYVYLNIPEISYFEWHPFAISSSPVMHEEVWLHIRVTGGPWTTALYDYVQEQPDEVEDCEVPEDMRMPKYDAAVSRVTGGSERTKRILHSFRRKYCQKHLDIPCYIDGPYGAPGMDAFLQVDHAIVIAMGIGIAPFASILQSVDAHFREGNTYKYPLKRVDFIWVNRNQSAFEWFLDILANFEATDEPDEPYKIHMQIYLTSALALCDLRGFGLQTALYSMFYRGNRDVISGLQILIRPGRPIWKQVLYDLQQLNIGFVNVFFSGNAEVGEQMRRLCRRRKMAYTKL